MDHLESYKVFEEFQDIDDGINLTSIFDKGEKLKDPDVQRLIELSKKGHLYKYVASGQRNLTFGMLKALHEDALEFKKNREYRQGIEKFLWRIIPIAFAPVFFPIWLISQAMGATRALNKIMSQVLKMKNKTYDGFLMNMVNKIFELTEGEIERLAIDDWFYKSFAIEIGLINMVKKEHIIEFSFYIVKKIQYQDDLAVVPPYYIDNEFRRFLNRKFKFMPPLALKIEKNKVKTKSATHYRMMGKKHDKF